MARERKVYVGDIGVRVIVNTGVSLEALSTATLFVEKPDGSTAVEWACAALGAVENGQIIYTTIIDDLNIKGIYRLYVKIEFTSGKTLHGERTYFRVYEPSEG